MTLTPVEYHAHIATIAGTRRTIPYYQKKQHKYSHMKDREGDEIP
jgi:hypothetical protein